MLETLQGDRFSQEKLTVGIWKIFSKCLVRSLSACQTMTNTCIVFRIKMVDIYIALRSYVADELDIVTIWCFMFSSSYKPHLKIEAYVDRKRVKGGLNWTLEFVGLSEGSDISMNPKLCHFIDCHTSERCEGWDYWNFRQVLEVLTSPVWIQFSWFWSKLLWSREKLVKYAFVRFTT